LFNENKKDGAQGRAPPRVTAVMAVYAEVFFLYQAFLSFLKRKKCRLVKK